MQLNEVKQLDKNDPLASKRAEFALPPNTLYLDGNSLGALPKSSAKRIKEVVSQQWGNDLISSWNKHHWIDLPIQTGEKIAPLIGAKSGQVIVCDSISVNLFKLLTAALNIQTGRNVVVSEQGNFPTDLYIVQGIEALLGRQRCSLNMVSTVDIESALTDDVAVLMLTHVNFKSGRIHDMKRLTKLAHDKGILVLWDLAHSAGALPVSLDECEADFAVGCGYKYLNGGPGAPAFLYVAHRHLDSIQQPLSGWMGHANPFQFTETYQPAAGIKQFLTGTPSVIAMASLDAALDIFENINMQQIREKSVGLTQCFLALKDQYSELKAMKLISPEDVNIRGSQLSFSHDAAYPICQALIDNGVVPDFRAPNIIRFGFTPLYLAYEDIFNAIEVLNKVITEKLYLNEKYQQRAAVT